MLWSGKTVAKQYLSYWSVSVKTWIVGALRYPQITPITQRGLAATKALHPERMRFSSRGQAALSDARGAIKTNTSKTLKGSNNYASLTLSGSADTTHIPWASRKGRSPTAINFGPCGTKNLLKTKQEWRLHF